MKKTVGLNLVPLTSALKTNQRAAFLFAFLTQLYYLICYIILYLISYIYISYILYVILSHTTCLPVFATF